MHPKIKIILISSLVLISMVAFGTVGFIFGVDSEKSKKIVTEKQLNLSKILDIDLPKCRDSYGEASRIWDCDTDTGSYNKNRCALSLTVNIQDDSKGSVFIDQLELNADYQVDGLTQLWKFSDGSKFELEPDGHGKYQKAQDQSGRLGSDLSFTKYVCTSKNM